MTRPINYGKAVSVNLPGPILKRLDEIAPKSGDRAYLLQQWIIEGINRLELDCLFCSIKERGPDAKSNSRG